jgi:hypothetical protein
MRTRGQEEKGVIVNKQALEAWLQAWTTGESFPSNAKPLPGTQKKETHGLATLRWLRLKMAK